MSARAAGRNYLPDPEYLTRATLQERVARGHALRKDVPHERLLAWAPSDTRADPIAILERQSAERIPELIPIRYGRMAAAPFAFYRGGAAIMAADLAESPVSGLIAQLCGDAHVMNFGLFETPERSLIFGLNDFDETLPGPIEWDVERLAASIEIAGRDLAFSGSEREAAVLATVRAYREAMLGFAERRDLEVWYERLPAEQLRARLAEHADPGSAKEVEKGVRKALHRDHLRAFDRLITTEDGRPAFIDEPPLLVPVERLLDAEQRTRYVEVIRSFLTQYREGLPPHLRALVERYHFAHIARKVVGVGSVGTRAWAVLLIGRDHDDPLILQLKEAKPSVLEPYTAPSVYGSQGRRVVEGQRFMQAASDSLLGWYHLTAWDEREHDFYVRQLWDGKASIGVAHLTPAGLRAYGEACGWTLARGHARSGDRIAMAAYLGERDTFDGAMAHFAAAYADSNEADHARLGDAIASGRIFRPVRGLTDPDIDPAILRAMAQQFSFDIVSEVDLQEVRNAVDQASREIHQRFDFKNTDTSITLGDEKIEMHSATEDRLKAAYQVLQEKAVRREVPLKALHPGEIEPAAKGTVRQTVTLVTGISDEKAKEISKFVRQSVSKVQTQIQGSQVRVTSKSKDDLQAAIQAVKEHDFGIALQFTNRR